MRPSPLSPPSLHMPEEYFPLSSLSRWRVALDDTTKPPAVPPPPPPPPSAPLCTGSVWSSTGGEAKTTAPAPVAMLPPSRSSMSEYPPPS